MPIFHAAVTAIVICLREAASRSDLVLIEILFNYQHQGFCIAIVEPDLPCFSALQRFARKLFYCWKSMPDWHLIEMVEKVECRGGHQYRPRIHQQQQSGMVHTV